MSDQDKGDDAEKPISVEDALGDLSSDVPESRQLEYEFEEFFSRRSVVSEELWIKLQGLKDHFTHKKRWSWLLMAIIGGMVAYQAVLIWMIGLGKLDFSQYEWLLPTLMIQYLTQIVGLAVFVVRSLFKDVN
jgi:hypothetical protein